MGSLEKLLTLANEGNDSNFVLLEKKSQMKQN